MRCTVVNAKFHSSFRLAKKDINVETAILRPNVFPSYFTIGKAQPGFQSV